MKNMARISGTLLILLMAGSLNLSAQRGRQGMRSDSLYMKHDSMRMRVENRRMSVMKHDSLNTGMRNYYHRMPGMAREMRGHFNYCPCMMGIGTPGMRHPYYGMMHGRGDMVQGTHGMRILENIPDLTAKQKDELTKLRESQQGEMKKIREKQEEELNGLRDAHRKKVMNILTDKQKKWFEENAPENKTN